MGDKQAKGVKRLILCSGKVYWDLVSSEYQEKNRGDIAIARVEQLYPIPTVMIGKVLKRYPKLKEVVAFLFTIWEGSVTRARLKAPRQCIRLISRLWYSRRL
jgi:hypothetical protein